MIRIPLPQAEARRLEELFRSADDRKLRDRLQVVRPAHKGRPRQQIACDLAIHRRSVTRWLNAYCDGGLEALAPRTPQGKTASIPEGLADEVKARVIGGPARPGLDRANRSHEELADHLLKAKGIKTSRSAVQRFGARIDARPSRPTYRYPRGDPAKQAKAREERSGHKQSAGR